MAPQAKGGYALIATANFDPAVDFPWLRDAVDWVLTNGVMSQKMLQNKAAKAKTSNFTSTGINPLQVIQDVRLALADAILAGENRDDFRQRLASQQIPYHGHDEALIRTETKNAYLATMNQVMKKPVVARVFPFVELYSTIDGRTREHHRPLNGLVIEVGSPAHAMITRALSDWNCRCGQIPKGESYAEKAISAVADLPQIVRQYYG